MRTGRDLALRRIGAIFSGMTVVRALTAVIVLTVAAPVAAQVPGQNWQPRPGAPAFDRNRFYADQHRYETDRLRAVADQNEAFARRLDIETRIRRLQVAAARLPEPVQPVSPSALRSKDEERALREAATARRQASTAAVGQIDAWLDRSPG